MFEDIFRDIEVDASLWVALRDHLQTSLALLPYVAAKPVLEFPSKPPTPESLRLLKARAIAAFGVDTQEAARALLHAVQKSEWPVMGDGAAYHLTIALDQMVRFLDLCFVPDSPRPVTMFRSPADNLTQLALWFCVRWWLDTGVYRWLADISSDEKIFYRFFARPSHDA
jgi:hypothetical protein